MIFSHFNRNEMNVKPILFNNLAFRLREWILFSKVRLSACFSHPLDAFLRCRVKSPEHVSLSRFSVRQHPATYCLPFPQPRISGHCGMYQLQRQTENSVIGRKTVPEKRVPETAFMHWGALSSARRASPAQFIVAILREYQAHIMLCSLEDKGLISAWLSLCGRIIKSQ